MASKAATWKILLCSEERESDEDRKSKLPRAFELSRLHKLAGFLGPRQRGSFLSLPPRTASTATDSGDAIGAELSKFLAHIFSRSTAGSFGVDGTDLEDVKVSKDRNGPSHYLRLPNIQNQSLLSGLAYCVASCSMILVNKFVLSGYGFNAGIFLMLYQVCYYITHSVLLMQIVFSVCVVSVLLG
jgi:hypothetical protein